MSKGHPLAIMNGIILFQITNKLFIYALFYYFLATGCKALFQLSENIPDWKNSGNSRHTIGVNSVTHVFKTIVGIVSRPVAFIMKMFRSSRMNKKSNSNRTDCGH